ncbi:MAG: short-chain dehydrogenase [Robiginitomaculum sp.]|nr:MAG: short-chain dehydrogenase [Robiginitomaculum sp.]
MSTSFATLLNLNGQTALISGASGHIGQQIARKLAEAGAKVVLHGHKNRDAAEVLAKDIRQTGGQALVLIADLAQPEAAQDLVRQAQKEGFAPDILVNNAARQDVMALSDMTEADWRAMFDATLHSAFALSHALCDALIKENKFGAIVNIASIEGLAAAAGHAHYASAKAALIHFTRAAALEYGPHHIRVNAVSPGLIDRPGLDKDWPEGVARWKASAPLGRLGTADDVANAVLYLASPMANWVSGENLIVDGGMLSGPNW